MIKALSVVVQHHDMLRVIVKDDTQIIKKYNENNLFRFKTYDLRYYSDKDELREKN